MAELLALRGVARHCLNQQHACQASAVFKSHAAGFCTENTFDVALKELIVFSLRRRHFVRTGSCHDISNLARLRLFGKQRESDMATIGRFLVRRTETQLS